MKVIHCLNRSWIRDSYHRLPTELLINFRGVIGRGVYWPTGDNLMTCAVTLQANPRS